MAPTQAPPQLKLFQCTCGAHHQPKMDPITKEDVLDGLGNPILEHFWATSDNTGGFIPSPAFESKTDLAALYPEKFIEVRQDSLANPVVPRALAAMNTLDRMTLGGLRAMAEADGIDLRGAETREEIIARIDEVLQRGE